MENYIINNNTCAIYQLNNKLVILENNRKLLINTKLSTILDRSCIYYGSSLKGRLTSSSYILDCKYKLPILIDESSDLIFLQTHSLRSNKCMLINLNKIKSLYSNEIMLTNDIMLTTNVSKNILINQMIKSLLLLNIINGRKALK